MENLTLSNGYTNGHSETIQKDSQNNFTSVGLKKSSDTSNNELHGPNQILPATDYTTTDPQGRVLIRMGTQGNAAEPPISVPGLMSRTVARYPDKIAYASKLPDGSWDKVTFKEYQQNVRTCAKAFIKLGLKRHHSVGILGFNCPQWFVSDLGAIHAGGFAAGIYTTNNAEACYHVLNNSRANIVVVEDTNQLAKILTVWSRLPLLKAVIQMDGNIKEPRDNVYSWNEIMAMGKNEPDLELDEIIKSIGINECCTLVYTSGTVGNPKGVMLSHDNVTWEAYILSQTTDVEAGCESIISYLPLSHVAAQILDIMVTLMNAVAVYFADKDALKGSVIKTIQDVRPTRFLGVPRVWEKIYEKMTAIGAANGMVKRLIGNWAKGQSLNYHMNAINGHREDSYGFWLAQMMVLSKVKAALGFSECKMFVTAAAPLSAEVKSYFLSLDMPILDVFGMSESGGAHSFATSEAFNLDSVGKPLMGVETMFHNMDPATGEGEICVKGRHIFMGYLSEPEKTKDTFSDNGWLHTGDVGRLDKDGFLYITGRIKELIITAGGENVAPVLIEQEVKKELPCISQAVVIGDRRKFLSILLTFKTETDNETGIPNDKLSSDSLRWLSSFGEHVTSLKEILNGNEKVMKEIQAGINRANSRAISNAQKVQKFSILPADLSIATEELGPTMKIKRSVVTKKYSDIIEEMYNV